MNTTLKKIYVYILFTSITFVIILYCYMTREEVTLYEHLMRRYNLRGSTSRQQCHIPKYDAYDKSILSYIFTWPKIDCGRPQYPLTYVDFDEYLIVNLSAVKEAEYPLEKLWCAYRVIKRKSDQAVIFLAPVKITHSVTRMKAEYFEVICFLTHDTEGKNVTWIYQTRHAIVRAPPRKLDLRSKLANEDGAVNVVIMVLDSMSRLNFIRQLPKTLDFLENQVNATVLKGLNKVGDNTLPNIMVLLCGLTTTLDGNTRNGIGPFYHVKNTTYFDDIPSVWKKFRSRGYITMFAEDCPSTSIFNYKTNGFKKRPTHYYMRHFWVGVKSQKYFQSNDSRCYGHVAKHTLIWNYTESFINKMHRGGNAHFTFSFLTGLSHDKINAVQVVDDELRAMLSRLHSSGALRNTLFIFMGDHGQRLDYIRKAVVGRVEDRMPFVAISLPDKLKHFRDNLRRNAEVLTSWYDVHELLMDVATKNYNVNSSVVRHGFHGSSLLRAVRHDRSCREVGVPTEYCVCNVERDMDTNSEHALVAAKEIIKHVNMKLKSGGVSSKCVTLIFDYVHSSQVTVQNFNSNDMYIRVVVGVRPSGALLESYVQVVNNSLQVTGDVNRINKYGDQSYCVDDRTLKMFCYCIDDFNIEESYLAFDDN